MKGTFFKKLGAVSLAVMLLAGAGISMPEVLKTNLTISAAQEAETPESCFSYREDIDGNAVITGFTGTQEVVIVPAQVGGMDVKTIDGWAFEGCAGVKRVVLPEGLELISASAFANCPNLRTVYIPSTVKEIGNSAFYLCKYLENVTIPNSVTYLGNSAFNGCLSLESVSLSQSLDCIHKTVFKDCTSLTTITIPGTVRVIEAQAFYGAGLESIAISPGLEEIGKNAFEDCTRLTEINIPATVILIEDKAFAGCTSLGAINMMRNNNAYASEDGVLFGADKKTLITCPEGKEGNYTIPNSVMSTDYHAFMNCRKLTGVTLSPKMDGLYSQVFYGCEGLTDFEVTDSITDIGSGAFGYCTGLKRITIPESVTSIDANAFVGCGALTILGKKGSAAETFAKEQGFSFDVILPELLNHSTISASSVRIGESIRVTCRGEGGDGNYQYEVAYKQKLADTWTTVRSGSDNSSVTITPESVGSYSVRVILRDGRGTAASQVFDLNVLEILNNLSTVSDNAVETGSSVTLTGASSGAGARQYAFYYAKPGSNEWVTLQSYSYKTSANVYLPTAGTYRVRVDVKETTGASVEKVMEVTAYDPLEATASVSESTVKLGESVTITTDTTGGFGAKTYQLSVKKPDSSTFEIVRPHGTQASISYKPTSAGTYTMRVEARDALDNTVRRELTLEAYQAIKFTASLSSNAIKVNTSVRVTFSATGGLGHKQYAVWYRKISDDKWVRAQAYSDKTMTYVTPRYTGTHQIRVKVRDERNKVVNRDLIVEVFAGLKNTSVLSDSSIKLGSTVTATASSTGGLGTVQYAFWYKKNNKWYQAQDYSENTAVSVKPKHTGTYTIRVKARDERGKVSNKDMTVTVFAALKNTSAISCESIKLGASVTVNASSTGGLGQKQYAVWYEKDNQWVKVQAYSAKTTAVITPKSTGTYTIRIIVKDERGVETRKNLALTVIK